MPPVLLWKWKERSMQWLFKRRPKTYAKAPPAGPKARMQYVRTPEQQDVYVVGKVVHATDCTIRAFNCKVECSGCAVKPMDVPGKDTFHAPNYLEVGRGDVIAR